MSDIRENVAIVERCMGKKFGDTEQPPLLFSVRSGAAVRDSLPRLRKWRTKPLVRSAQSGPRLTPLAC